MGISPTCFAGIGRNFMLPREQWCKGAKAYFNTTSFHGKQMLLLLGVGERWGFFVFFIVENWISVKFSLKSAGDETAYNTIYLLKMFLISWSGKIVSITTTIGPHYCAENCQQFGVI